MDWLTDRQGAPADAHVPDVKVPLGMENVWDGAVNFFGLQSVLSPSPQLEMFSGVKTNLKFSDLSGWRMELCKPAHEATSMADFNVPGVPKDSVVLMGAKRPNEDELLLAAICRLDVIATLGNLDHHHTGVYRSLEDRYFAFANDPVGRVAWTTACTCFHRRLFVCGADLAIHHHLSTK